MLSDRANVLVSVVTLVLGCGPGSTGPGIDAESSTTGHATDTDSTESTETTETGDGDSTPLCGDTIPVAGERCWHAVETLPTGAAVEIMKVFDLDGDGYSEVLFGRATGANYVARGGPEGLAAVGQVQLDRRFRAVCDDPRGLAIGSLFAVEQSGQEMTLARIEQDPSDPEQLRVHSRIEISNYGLGCAVAELDGDQLPEVVVTLLADDSVTTIDVEADTLAVLETVPVGTHPRGVRAFDIDEDGRDELFLTLDNHVGSFGAPDSYTDPGQVVILRTNAIGGLIGPTTHEVMYQPIDLDVGDLDGDGSADIIAVGLNSSVEAGVATAPDPGDEVVSILWGDADGGFGQRLDLEGGNSARNARIGDFDDDGRLDFATVTYSAVAEHTILQLWFSGPTAREFERLDIDLEQGLMMDFGRINGDDVVDFVVHWVLSADLEVVNSNP